MSTLKRLALKLLSDDSGQDLIEYALLTTIVTLVGVTVFSTIQDQMEDLYESWLADFADDTKWIPPNPLS